MRTTLADVKRFVEGRGMEPVVIDGIPEGFSFKHPDVIISGKEHKGSYVVYVPLSDWHVRFADTPERLLELYNNEKIDYGKGDFTGPRSSTASEGWSG